jgi:predicted alpha/beta-hydrolase family hydrolase
LKNSPNRITVPIGSARAVDGSAARLAAGSSVTALTYPAGERPVGATLVLGHGAGAGQQSTFMVTFAQALSALGLDIVTFDFPYIEQRRKIPDRAPVLEACFRSVIEAATAEMPSAKGALFAGGKSMGGRIATQVAAAAPAPELAGLVLLGYPLHPPGKPDQRRDAHLADIRRPMLFVHGTRDAFGSPVELTTSLDGVRPPATIHFVEGGDHSFKISKKDPNAQAAVYANVQQVVVSWITSIVRNARPEKRPPPR